MIAKESIASDSTELAKAIKQEIIRRTWGRISGLRVAVHDDRVTIHGLSSSFYMKQLVITAITEVLGGRTSFVIEVNVRVGTSDPWALQR